MSTDSTLPPPATTPARPRRDVRWRALLLVIVAVLLLGAIVEWLPGRATQGEARRAAESNNTSDPFAGLVAGSGHAGMRRELAESEDLAESQTKPVAPGKPRDALQQAAQQIKGKQYDAALHTLNSEQAQLRSRPEAYVLIGRALEGRDDFATARDFYAKAIDMDPYYAEAYWGYATSSESLGDLESALGAMRSFLHANPDPDPKRLRIAQARAAIWEWESQLGRGPWGPTKGIMPGLKPEEQRKDDRGVAILMPKPGTEKPDGSAKYEIKHQSKFKLFEPDK